jgi:hypothetical protein
VSNVDFAPTIVAAAGASAGKEMDGRSLWPILRDAGIHWGRDLLHETAAADGAALAGAAVRTPRWMYFELVKGEAELYDLSNDPHEMQSIHADPSRAAVRADLARRLAALRSCAGAGCRREPALAASARIEGACPAATGKVILRGADYGRVTRVRFSAGDRLLAMETAAPFQAVVPLRLRPTFVRVHSYLDDGRELTRDLRLRGCSR